MLWAYWPGLGVFMFAHAFSKVAVLRINIVEANILFRAVKGAKRLWNIFIDFFSFLLEEVEILAFFSLTGSTTLGFIDSGVAYKHSAVTLPGCPVLIEHLLLELWAQFDTIILKV